MATNLQLNPTVNDPFPTKTLSALRQAVFDALGFTNLQQYNNTDVGFRTLGELTTSVRTALGLAAPVPVIPDTLVNIRNNVYNMLGMGAMSIHPPGVDSMLTSFINTAQQIIFRALEVDAGGVAQDLGPENVTNGTFSGSASGWALGAEWAYSSNSIVNNNASTHTLAQQQFNVVAGQTYLVQWQQTQSAPYVPSSNTGGQGIIASLGVTQANPVLLQTIGATVVSVAITAIATGGLTLAFQNATGSPALPGFTPSGTVAITNISCKAMGSNTILGTQPPPMLVTGTSDNSFTKLDSIAITNLATALAKQYYGQADATDYLQWYQKWLKDLEGRGPPNIQNIIINSLQDAQRAIARTYEVQFAVGATVGLSSFVNATDAPTLDGYAIYKLALANLQTLMKLPNAQVAMKEYDKYITDLYKRCPPEATTLINRLLKQAQDFLFRTYSVFRMERWFTWTLVAGQRFYGTLADDASSVSSPTNVTATVGTAAGSFGFMATPRALFTSAALPDGTIMVMGGQNASNTLTNLTEIYTPSTGLFTAGPSMTTARRYATATTLNNGLILVYGGESTNGAIPTAELYNPTTKIFTSLGNTLYPRGGHTATLLNNGKVLIAGGGSSANNSGNPAVCEIFDPATNVFSTTGAMSTGRFWHTATLLANGKVLIAGGQTVTDAAPSVTCEIYDPATGTFSATGSMGHSRQQHNAHALSNGSVLVLGGLDNGGAATALCELYNVGAGTWGATGALPTAKIDPSSIVLASGNVFYCGGSANAGGTTGTNTGAFYNVSTGAWTATTNTMAVARDGQRLRLLNGNVLVIGGAAGSGSIDFVASTNTVEVYNPTTNAFGSTNNQVSSTSYYRVANFNTQGFTIPSLPDAIVTGVSVGSSVVINWVNSNNPSVDGSAIYGRSVSASTTTVGTFIIPSAGSTGNVVTLTSATGITVGTTPSINDGTNTILIKVTGVAGNVITYTLTQIFSGAVANIMATGASVLLSSEQLLAVVGAGITTWTDFGTITPNGAMPTVNSTASAFGMDPREVSWVGASCNQNTWRRLIEGVPPQIYNAAVSGPPQYYEIRQAIEIWPSPPDSTWQLQIKGYFSPLPFEADTDTCWIDWQAIYLYATAKAKAHYKQTDARDYERDWMNYVKQLVAGTHKTARYIPGQAIRPIRPLPVAVPPFS